MSQKIKKMTNKTNKEAVVENLEETNVVANTAPVPSPEPTKEELQAQEKAQADQKEVQEFLPKLSDFLKDNNMALQPFMRYEQFGVRPDVAIVKVPEEKQNEEKK